MANFWLTGWLFVTLTFMHRVQKAANVLSPKTSSKRPSVFIESIENVTIGVENPHNSFNSFHHTAAAIREVLKIDGWL